MKYKIIIILFFFFGYTNAQTEINFPEKSNKELKEIRTDEDINLNGLWEGKISQLTWQGQPEFAGVSGKLHVEITQKGNQVNGLIVVRAKFANNQGYLSYEKTFKGNWDGETLVYQDVKIDNYINTHKKLRHLETCIKAANLSFYRHGGQYHLEGEWSGKGHISDVPCIPGNIHLTKVMEENLAVEEATTFNVNFASTDKGPVEVKFNKDNQVKKLRDRKVEKGKTIEVENTYLSITVYDHKRNDGDIISLNYNDNWILEKYRINNDEHQIDVVLDDAKNAKNYMILYAHNLGESPPNTVAIIVDDGKTRQRFILNSDMNTCDVIYFQYNGKGKKK